tara:strand:- start:1906 stop:2880 length:975 start_codon:yes stop_codon:yes gene_type:complete
MAYRQTPGRGPTANFKNITSLLGPTVIEGGGVDPETGVKIKTKTNRKGEIKEVIRTKDASGRKTKTTNIKGPVETTTTPAPKPTKITISTPETASSSFKVPTQTITPGSSTEGSNTPYVKPLKKDSYRDAYEKTDKSIPYPDFKEKSIKWNKENPGKNNPPKLDVIKAKPAMVVQPGFSSTFTIKGVPTTSTSTYSSTKTKVKDPKKIDINLPKVNFPQIDINLPKIQPKNQEVCTPNSKSLSCVGEGTSDKSLFKPGKGSDGLQAKGFEKSNVSNKKAKRKVTSKEFVGFSQLGQNIKKRVKSKGLLGGKKRREIRRSKRSTR